MASGPKSSSERIQTDESLREEREQTDRKLVARQAAAQDNADQVIQRARDTADAVLTAARDKADDRPGATFDGVPGPAVVEGRELEDDVIRDERAMADATLQRERAETKRALARLLPVERDKTDRFLLTERARSDKDIAQRDDFLGMVSHDLRNLLGSIVMCAGILAEKTQESDDTPFVQATTARIERYAARMNRLIGDLVDVASIDAGVLAMRYARGDALKVIGEVVESFRPAAAAKGVQIDVEIGAEELLADFDHDRLLQVFANLLSNAIKFTDKGKPIIVAAARDEDMLRFSVADGGIGVSADMLELIFERFWQVGKNDRRGVGLGLYISRCIVEAHGGTIWADSSGGTGTTLHFTLPVTRIVPTPTPPSVAV